MASRSLSVLLLNLALVFGASAAYGQDQKLVDDCAARFGKSDDANVVASRKDLCKTLARYGSINQAVPDSPAFVALGISTDNVARPTNPSDFVASILNGVDPNGNLQTGIAIDTNPYMLYFGDRISLAKYQDSYITQLLANTQFSFATAKASDDDESTRVALGLHITPWMAMDPRGKGSPLLTCLAKRIQAALDSAGSPPGPLKEDGSFKTDAERERDDLAYKNKLESSIQDAKNDPKQYAACEGDFQKKASNSSGWTIGFTPSWISKNGGLDDLDDNGFALWSSLAFNLANLGIGGLEEPGQVIVHLRYLTDQQVADSVSPGNFIEQDSIVIGGKLRFDGPESGARGAFKNVKFALEFSYIDADRKGLVDDSFFQAGGNVQFQLPGVSDKIWIDLSFGSTTGREEKDNAFARLSFKWNYNDTSPQ